MWKVINKFGDVVLRNLTAKEVSDFMGKNLYKDYKYKPQNTSILNKLKQWINKN
mgnify:CR=1 FL=1|tara:strand:+ start:231 stop:392 length:162 start_codon:yes stop_codon:yes gene_type:complete